MPDELRKESVGFGIRGPGVQYLLEVTFCYWNFLSSRIKASDAKIANFVQLRKTSIGQVPLVLKPEAAQAQLL